MFEFVLSSRCGVPLAGFGDTGPLTMADAAHFARVVPAFKLENDILDRQGEVPSGKSRLESDMLAGVAEPRPLAPRKTAVSAFAGTARASTPTVATVTVRMFLRICPPHNTKPPVAGSVPLGQVASYHGTPSEAIRSMECNRQFPKL